MNNILFLSPADWHGPRGRFQHIAEGLSSHNKLAYFDGLGVRPIGLRDWRRVLNKFKLAMSAASTVRRETPRNILHVSPLAVPIQGNSIIGVINRAVLHRVIQNTLDKLGGSGDPLIWISYPHPDLVKVLERFPNCHVIYDCVDHWSEFNGAFGNLAQAERTLIERADIVFATAELLQERVARYHPRCYLVPNGVDVEGYALALAESPSIPADVQPISRPRIGFIGNIAHWLEFDWIRRLVINRPEWQFVFVGPWQLLDAPPESPNFHWLGARNYETIPYYIASFDVCLIPFKDNELTRAVDPLKLYEYLAVGRPVVSTALPRLFPFSEFVEIASTEEAFQEGILRALADRSVERDEHRRRSVIQHSWTARLRCINEHIERDLGISLMPDPA